MCMNININQLVKKCTGIMLQITGIATRTVSGLSLTEMDILLTQQEILGII